MYNTWLYVNICVCFFEVWISKHLQDLFCDRKPCWPGLSAPFRIASLPTSFSQGQVNGMGESSNRWGWLWLVMIGDAADWSWWWWLWLVILIIIIPIVSTIMITSCWTDWVIIANLHSGQFRTVCSSGWHVRCGAPCVVWTSTGRITVRRESSHSFAAFISKVWLVGNRRQYLCQTNITMENHHFSWENGKTHYFNGHFQ